MINNSNTDYELMIIMIIIIYYELMI